MSAEVIHPDEQAAFLESRRNVLLWPAVLATLVGGALLGLWLLAGVMVVVVMHEHPHWLNPSGGVVLRPSRAEEIRNWILFLWPVALGTLTLLMTWRFRAKGQRVATCVCAAATILLGFYCWV